LISTQVAEDPTARTLPDNYYKPVLGDHLPADVREPKPDEPLEYCEKPKMFGPYREVPWKDAVAVRREEVAAKEAARLEADLDAGRAAAAAQGYELVMVPKQVRSSDDVTMCVRGINTIFSKVPEGLEKCSADDFKPEGAEFGGSTLAEVADQTGNFADRLEKAWRQFKRKWLPASPSKKAKKKLKKKAKRAAARRASS